MDIFFNSTVAFIVASSVTTWFVAYLLDLFKNRFTTGTSLFLKLVLGFLVILIFSSLTRNSFEKIIESKDHQIANLESEVQNQTILIRSQLEKINQGLTTVKSKEKKIDENLNRHIEDASSKSADIITNQISQDKQLNNIGQKIDETNERVFRLYSDLMSSIFEIRKTVLENDYKATTIISQLNELKNTLTQNSEDKFASINKCINQLHQSSQGKSDLSSVFSRVIRAELYDQINDKNEYSNNLNEAYQALNELKSKCQKKRKLLLFKSKEEVEVDNLLAYVKSKM
jgi:hypothetical protein